LGGVRAEMISISVRAFMRVVLACHGQDLQILEKVFLAETLDQWANQAFDYRKPAEAVRASCRQACLYRDFWGGRGQNRPWVHSVDWYPSLCGEAGTTLPKEEDLT
jgi:hypothetical protein